jgi:ferric-dicitrate binding protein FerR (iron transport regulator)
VTHFTQQQNEHLWQLMSEKVAGIISDKDQLYLEEQLRKDESMQEALHALELTFGHNNPESLNADEDWQNLLAFTNAKPGVRPITVPDRLRTYKVAAILSGVLLAGACLYFLLHRPAASQAAPLAAAEPGQVTLQLASNKTVLLSDQTSSISLGDVQLHNTADSLTFSSANGFSVNNGQHTLTVPVARSYKVILADGSKVLLNAGSRLQFPFNFNGSSREITLLSGEAFIEVAANAAQPFIVHTPNSAVQVLGTSFNINAYDPYQVQLSLVSGAVKMNTNGEAVVLKPGMEAVYTPARGLYTQPFEEQKVLAWTTGKHFFSRATLTDICNILYRHMGITAVIDSNSKAKEVHFNGMVDKNKPIQEFMEDVKNMTGVDYYFDRQGVLHFR